MITVNGWCAGGKGGGLGEGGDECPVNGGDGERLLSKLPPTVSLRGFMQTWTRVSALFEPRQYVVTQRGINDAFTGSMRI